MREEEEVIVVGGGNSAGQAAVFLAQTTKRAHMLVRSSNLAASMSRYLQLQKYVRNYYHFDHTMMSSRKRR